MEKLKGKHKNKQYPVLFHCKLNIENLFSSSSYWPEPTEVEEEQQDHHHLIQLIIPPPTFQPAAIMFYLKVNFP